MNSKILLAPCLFGLLVFGAFGQEFEVNSSTRLNVSSDPSALVNAVQGLDGSYSHRLDARDGSFDVKGHLEVSGTAGFSGDLDALSFKLNFLQPGPELKTLRWTLGRFAFADASGLVLNHPVDGTVLDFDFGGTSLEILAAYTGLVLRSSSGVALSLADVDSSGPFATPRFVGGVKTAWTFASAHVLTFEGLAQQDLTPRSRLVDEWTTVFAPGKGGKVNSQYLTLQVAGPVVDRVFYDATAVLVSGSTLSWIADAASATGFEYQYRPILGFLAQATVDYFLPEWFSSTVKFRALAASGDADAESAVEGNTAGDSNLFLAVTPSPLGTVFSPALANLGYYELGGTMKPLAGVPLVLSLKLMAFHRLVSGVVGAPGVLKTGPGWLGQETDAAAVWQPLSDLQVTAGVGVFLPGTGTYAPSAAGAKLQYAGSVGARISF